MTIDEAKARFGLVGAAPDYVRAIEVALQVAPIDLSVLIIGESGAGKEAFPKIIHADSRRKHQPYVAVNCGAIPEGTIDSELFGHLKGAFTGALSDRKGYFEEANGGTIFLDEIGELPLATQAKLLRVLESGEFMRMGSSEVRKTDVRVVAATNVDLQLAIDQGRFRQDLFYRLNGILIRVPPLRDRPGDVGPLFHLFTQNFGERQHMPPCQVDDEARDLLARYPWPGNVRQLKNLAEQCTALKPGCLLSANDLQRLLPGTTAAQSLLPVVGGAPKAEDGLGGERELIYKFLADVTRDVRDLKKLVRQMLDERNGGVTGVDVASAHRILDSDEALVVGDEGTLARVAEPYNADVVAARPAEEPPLLPTEEATAHFAAAPVAETVAPTLEEHEIRLIREALLRNKYNKRKTAKELNISERTLYRKIKEFQLA